MMKDKTRKKKVQNKKEKTKQTYDKSLKPN